MIDWVILRMTVCTERGPVIGPGLIAREYAKTLLARDYDRMLKTGIVRELRENARADPDG